MKDDSVVVVDLPAQDEFENRIGVDIKDHQGVNDVDLRVHLEILSDRGCALSLLFYIDVSGKILITKKN